MSRRLASNAALMSVGAVLLAETGLRRFPSARDLAVLTVPAVVENFGYRHINNLWRIQGTIDHLRRVRGWGTMTRTGFRRSGAR